MAVAFVRPGPLEQIGAALEARLQLVFPPERFVHQWMPARVDMRIWQNLTRKLPMVALGFNRFARAERTQNLAAVSDWSLYVATGNEAGPRAQLFGDAQAPGLFSLLQVGAATIHGYTIPDIGTVQVHEGTHAVVEGYTEDRIAIATVDFSVVADMGVSRVLSGDGVTPVDLTTHVIQWAFGAADTIVQTDTIEVTV